MGYRALQAGAEGWELSAVTEQTAQALDSDTWSGPQVYHLLVGWLWARFLLAPDSAFPSLKQINDTYLQKTRFSETAYIKHIKSTHETGVPVPSQSLSGLQFYSPFHLLQECWAGPMRQYMQISLINSGRHSYGRRMHILPLMQNSATSCTTLDKSSKHPVPEFPLL